MDATPLGLMIRMADPSRRLRGGHVTIPPNCRMNKIMRRLLAVHADTDKRRGFDMPRFSASLNACRSSRRLSVRLNLVVRLRTLHRELTLMATLKVLVFGSTGAGKTRLGDSGGKNVLVG